MPPCANSQLAYRLVDSPSPRCIVVALCLGDAGKLILHGDWEERNGNHIVGAGPAGLAVGACLQRAGIPFLILEQAATVGATWHGHYDRLHLHTPKSLSALPYLSFPKDYPRYPSRLQVIDYLEEYAGHFALAPKFGQRVVAARPSAGGWEVQTQDARLEAANLVVATGLACAPYLPQWPGQADFQGSCLHSSAYRNGEPFRQRRVLVVGFGNSGGEIALDLWEHGAQTSMAVRSPVNVVPREVLGTRMWRSALPKTSCRHICRCLQCSDLASPLR